MQQAEQVLVHAAGREGSSPGSGLSRFKSMQQAEKVRVQAAGRASSNPGSGQSKFESMQQAEKVRVQAAGRAGSSQGTGRLAETRRRKRGPVHSVSSTQASYNAK